MKKMIMTIMAIIIVPSVVMAAWSVEDIQKVKASGDAEKQQALLDEISVDLGESTAQQVWSTEDINTVTNAIIEDAVNWPSIERSTAIEFPLSVIEHAFKNQKLQTVPWQEEFLIEKIDGKIIEDYLVQYGYYDTSHPWPRTWIPSLGFAKEKGIDMVRWVNSQFKDGSCSVQVANWVVKNSKDMGEEILQAIPEQAFLKTLGEARVPHKEFLIRSEIEGILEAEFTVQEMLQIVMEDFGSRLPSYSLFRQTALDRATKDLVRIRRIAGEPVAVYKDKNGDVVNPLEKPLSPIIKALNAPAFDGLEREIRSMGVECLDVSRAKTEKYRSLPEDLLMRLEPPTPDELNRVKYLLGVDGYNEWRKTYNE